jgi:hypothetical protein
MGESLQGSPFFFALVSYTTRLTLAQAELFTPVMTPGMNP